MYTNLENLEWNTKHQGKRVPINDTDVDGAPFALSGGKNWVEGNVNSSVYSTFLLQDSPPVFSDQIKADLGQLGFKDLLKYTNNEMLYGYSTDARNKVPGDLMSYRAYPTSIVTSHALVLTSNPSTMAWDYVGNPYGSSGQFVVMDYSVTIKFKVPYDIVFTAELTNGPTAHHTVELRIASGSLNVTHYRLVGESIWVELPNNKVYFSVDSSSLTGSQTFTITVSEFVQTPYYGDLSPLDLIVSISASAPVATTLGPAYYGDGLSEFTEYVEACREYSEADLVIKAGAPTLYLKNVDTLDIGTVIYLDEDATTPSPSGQFMFVVPAYYDTDSGQNIYSAETYFVLNSSGEIITLFNPVEEGYMGAGCWVDL